MVIVRLNDKHKTYRLAIFFAVWDEEVLEGLLWLVDVAECTGVPLATANAAPKENFGP